MNQYEFDIAFTFLKDDEPLVEKLNDVLKTRVNTFLYSEHQNLLAGANGEDEFNKVFAEKARIVLILYRPTWGTKGWTRIERTAIQNRSMEDGYDFVTLVPMDGCAPPKWLPKNRIWVDYNRFGFDALIPILESRITAAFGEIHEESAIDKVARMHKEQKSLELREGLVHTNGLIYAAQELKILKQSIIEFEIAIKKKTPDWHFTIINKNGWGENVNSNGYSLNITWNQRYSNSITDSYLQCSIFKGYKTSQSFTPNEIELYVTGKYQLTINKYDVLGWVNLNDESEFYTTKDLVGSWCTIMINESIENPNE